MKFDLTNRIAGNYSNRTLSLILNLAVCLVFPTLGSAADSSDRYQSLCTGTQTSIPEVENQWKEYCAAAFSSQEAAKANSSLVTVYTGVAAVCTTACVTSFFAPIPFSNILCMGSTAAGAIIDVVKTKQYASALTSIGALGAGFLVNNSFGKDGGDTPKTQRTETPSGSGEDGVGGGETTGEQTTQTPESKPSKKDIGSCIQAAAAGFQAFMKNSAAKSDAKAANLNLDQVDSLKSQTDAYIASLSNVTAPSANNLVNFNTLPTGVQTGSTNSGNFNGNNLSDNNLSGKKDKSSSIFTSNQACAKLTKRSDFKSQLNCAISTDPRLPAAVRNPKFPEAIQKISGLTPDQFASEVQRSGPSGGILRAGNSFGPANPDGTRMLGAALKNLEPSDASLEQSQAYVSNGSSTGGSARISAASGGSSDPNINQLISEVMDKLLPKNQGDPNDPLSDPNHKKETTLGERPEDRKLAQEKIEELRLSLFARVSKRYHLLTPKILDINNINAINDPGFSKPKPGSFTGRQ